MSPASSGATSPPTCRWASACWRLASPPTCSSPRRTGRPPAPRPRAELSARRSRARVRRGSLLGADHLEVAAPDAGGGGAAHVAPVELEHLGHVAPLELEGHLLSRARQGETFADHAIDEVERAA